MGNWAAFGLRGILALWVGGVCMFSFLTTPAIFRGYDRDRAGEIVGRLIGGYFLHLETRRRVAIASTHRVSSNSRGVRE